MKPNSARLASACFRSLLPPLLLLGVVTLATVPLTARAQFTYVTNSIDNTIAITGYVCSYGDVTIPENANGLPVTAIGSWAFSSCSLLTGVTIPDSVTNIGANAFYHCIGLARASIGNGVTSIGRSAFEYCRVLSNLTIGTHVTNIDDSAFYYCTNLPQIRIPDSVISNGSDAFRACTKATNLIIGTNVVSLGRQAFESCLSLTRLTVPDSVIYIYDWTFVGCSGLVRVTIGRSVTYIGTAAFGGNYYKHAIHFRGNAPNQTGTDPFDVNSTLYYLPGTTGWTPVYKGRPAIPWNPSIRVNDADFGVRSNQFGFRITGSTNIPILVEAAADLAQPVWQTVQTCALTNGSLYVGDPQWTNHARRFYRISWP